MVNLEALTSYKIIYSGVDEKPEIKCKCLKRLVGANGFEPSTSWSRTRRASQAALRPDRQAEFVRHKLRIQISTALHPRLYEACPVSPGLVFSFRRACDSPFNRLKTVL